MNVILDNASNNLKVIDFLKPRFFLINYNTFHIKCATHIYRLIIKDGVDILVTKLELHVIEFLNLK